MPPLSRRQHRIRQGAWIACAVVVLTVLVVVISWMTSGAKPAKDPARSAVAPIPTAEVDRPSFAPEAPAPGHDREPLPEANPAPPSAPIEVADLGPSLTPEPPPSLAVQEAAPAMEPPPRASATPPKTVPAPPPPKPIQAPPAPPAASGFGVQVGAFGAEATARDMKVRLERLGYRVALLPKGDLTRVVATGFSDRAAAQKAQEKLRTQGAPQAQVIALD